MLRIVEALFTKSDWGSIAKIAASETSVQRRCAFAPFWTYQPPPPLVQPFDVGGLSCCRPPKPAELFQDFPMPIGSIGIYVFHGYICIMFGNIPRNFMFVLLPVEILQNIGMGMPPPPLPP